MSTIQELAKQLSDALETQTRDNGQEFVCLKFDSPKWMTTVIHAVHGEKLPNDTVYEFIERAASVLADADDPQEAIIEMEPDSYTHELTAWLNARVDHVYYLSEVLQEYGQITDGFQLLALAQQKQIQEVASDLLTQLEKLSD